MNLVSDQAHGSSSARTWNKSSSSAVTFPAHVGLMRCSWASTKMKDLIFVAKVKNGFVPRIRDEIFPLLTALQTAQCPFKNLPEKRASRWGESLTAEKMEQCRWVKPKLVCQVAFVEWTEAGHLRHCTFIAMRDDKKPGEVVRET
jgi:ATP-dependent DNA ligase